MSSEKICKFAWAVFAVCIALIAVCVAVEVLWSTVIRTPIGH